MIDCYNDAKDEVQSLCARDRERAAAIFEYKRWRTTLEKNAQAAEDLHRHNSLRIVAFLDNECSRPLPPVPPPARHGWGAPEWGE